jgi:hypothetical protein
MRKIFLISMITTLLSTGVPSAYADDYEPADEPTNSTNEFILDADNSGGDIEIKFGAILNESLRYDATDLRFELSDPLSLEGHELEDFRIENIASDPACTGGDEGRMYYNTGSDTLLFCNGTSFGALGGGGGSSVDQTNLVYVDGTRTTQVGESYNTLAAAIVYINTQTPGSGNRWVILMEPGSNAESVTIPTFTVLVGRDRQTTTLTGTITMSASSALQGVTVSGTGEVDIPAATTGYISDADVIIDDGALGGIDGTLVIHDSYIDGEIATGAAVMAYNSLIGPTGLINDGTLATYHSTVLTLTNNNIWNNFGAAYNNATSGLTATNTQAAIDELRTSNTFTIDSDDAGSDQVQLNFGTPEFLLWDDVNDYFFISDALVVDGNVNLQGTTLTLDSDETGNPDQDLSIVAEQGSENNGVLRYDDGNNRWELSNDGASFQPISTGAGGGGTAEYFDAYDSAGATDISGGYTDIPLGTQRKITSDFTHTPGNANVVINTTGTYIVTYAATTEVSTGATRSQSDARLMIDTGSGFVLVPGSVGTMYNREVTEGTNTATRTFMMDLDLGDELKVQASQISGANVQTRANGSALTIARVEGVGATGATGATGPAGADGTNTLAIEDEGGVVAGGPHGTLNFVGAGVSVVDAGAGEATVTIGDDANTLDTLDSTQFLRSDTSDTFTSGTLTTDNGTTLAVAGTANIGDGADDVFIDSNDWDISSAGVASGFTGLTSTGGIDFSGASSFRVRSAASNPGTCTVGEQYYNTTRNVLRVCTATNTWSSLDGGWMGSQTRLKITPMDFQTDDKNDNLDMSADGSFASETGSASPVGTYAIPTGFRATEVMIFGSDSGNAVDVYRNEISDGTTAVSLGSGNVGTLLNITDLDSSITNYLTIFINVGNNDKVFGGYITIEPIP